MNFIRQISKIIILAAGMLYLTGVVVTAQTKKNKKRKVTPIAARVSSQFTSFVKEADGAGIDFKLPVPFKELPAVNNENFTFDYAMTMPGQDFEVWFQVHSLKQNWSSYEQVKNITGKTLANPDSTYLNAARAHASALSDDDNYFMRPLPESVLEMYNADAGKTYLFDLANMPETRNYKYALLIAIQKHHIGYVMAVCLTNVKGPEFFKNINKARNCIKFR
ncbi:hypothetical protein [Mucilaginibacter terrae]|uniref:hypothetical protein n=1 Tax=Mucilaginibacter terrae TaxID=1955052 RepID=UPI00366F6F10